MMNYSVKNRPDATIWHLGFKNFPGGGMPPDPPSALAPAVLELSGLLESYISLLG